MSTLTGSAGHEFCRRAKRTSAVIAHSDGCPGGHQSKRGGSCVDGEAPFRPAGSAVASAQPVDPRPLAGPGNSLNGRVDATTTRTRNPLNMAEPRRTKPRSPDRESERHRSYPQLPPKPPRPSGPSPTHPTNPVKRHPTPVPHTPHPSPAGSFAGPGTC